MPELAHAPEREYVQRRSGSASVLALRWGPEQWLQSAETQAVRPSVLWYPYTEALIAGAYETTGVHGQPATAACIFLESTQVVEVPDATRAVMGARAAALISAGYDRETIARAERLLVSLQSYVNEVLPTPRVNGAEETSIDLYWRSPTATLLINVPAGQGDPIAFSGGVPDSDTEFSGNVASDDESTLPLLARWLTRTHA